MGPEGAYRSGGMAVGPDVEAGRRRFREELARIPVRVHAVYGRCLAPTYPSQLFIALGQLASLPIGGWRGQADIDWGLDSSLVRRYRAHRGSGSVMDEENLRAVE